MICDAGAPISRRVFILATAVVTAGCLNSQPRGTLRLAAGEAGGLYLAIAQTLADRITVRYPGIGVSVIATEGSVQNLNQLRSSNADLGLAQADVAERDRVVGPVGTAPEAVARLYEDYLQLVVRNTAAVQRISDLQGSRVSIGPDGSGVAITSEVVLEAAGLRSRVDTRRYRLRDGLAGLAEGSLDALVWSGGVPTPAIADLNATLPLRVIDLSRLAEPMRQLSGYRYLVRPLPAGEYVPPGLRTIGIPDLLLCRQGLATDLVSAVVDVLTTDAPALMPPSVRGLEYLDPPSMIQTGRIPLHPAAITAFDTLHG
jgi:TRAP transporter TAXI family solute receptor